VLERPSSFVHLMMVAATHETEVLEIGGTALLERHQVVGIAPAPRSVTTGEHATAVACHERQPLRGRHQTATPAEVEQT
jgi:hypothetical protein